MMPIIRLFYIPIVELYDLFVGDDIKCQLTLMELFFIIVSVS